MTDRLREILKRYDEPCMAMEGELLALIAEERQQAKREDRLEHHRCPVCGQPYERTGPGPDPTATASVAFRHSDGRICVDP